jgi:hypothetical protein
LKLKDKFRPGVGLTIRLFWVFLTAPLVGSLAWIVTVSLPVLLGDGLSRFEGDGLLVLLMVTAMYAYPVTFVIGIPSYIAYRRLQISRLQTYIVGGFVGGFIVGVSIFHTFDSSVYMPPFVASVIVWLTVAIAAAIETGFFWALVIRSRSNVS